MRVCVFMYVCVCRHVPLSPGSFSLDRNVQLKLINHFQDGD